MKTCIIVVFCGVSALCQATGYIQVDCEPDVIVFMDGEFRGITKADFNGLIIQDVPVGKHKLRAVKEGFASQEADVFVDGGKVLKFKLQKFVPKVKITEEGKEGEGEVKAKTGTIIINSIPIDCSVDCQALGISKYMKQKDTVEMGDVREGTYELIFKRKDIELKHTITLKDKMIVKLLINFVKQKVEELSASSKEGAEIRTIACKDQAFAVAVAPDSKSVLSGGDDKIVFQWEVESGRELKSFPGHTSRVWSVTFSSDGALAASASDDNSIRIWSVETGKLLNTLPGHQYWVFAAAFAPDNKTIASCGYDRKIKLWNVDDGKVVREFAGHENWVSSVSFSRDGKFIASGSWDKTVRLWDVATGKEAAKFSGHSMKVASVELSPDGSLVASGSADGTVKLWDVSSGKEVASFSSHTDSVNCVAFSKDGKYLASGSTDQSVRIWDVAGKKETNTLLGHVSQINSLCFAPDGSFLASAGSDKNVKLWRFR